VVNLTQALADEWAGDGVRINCVNPERTATPMRTKAFGQEPEGTLLTSQAVAETSLDVLISTWTGHIIDVRREDKLASHVSASVTADILQDDADDLIPEGVDPVAVHGD
jgi:2-C-methyl-D-erythritol 4-phosphate cytidylyltransferase